MAAQHSYWANQDIYSVGPDAPVLEAIRLMGTQRRALLVCRATSSPESSPERDYAAQGDPQGPLIPQTRPSARS